MMTVFGAVSVILYFLVGIVCLVMAFKTMTAKEYLPFHEKGAGVPWNKVPKNLQTVILTLLRLSGLGFLVTGVLLTVFPAVFFFLNGGRFAKAAVPAVSLVFCAGVFLFNYGLYRKTGAETPWKGTVMAMVVLAAGLVLSFF